MVPGSEVAAQEASFYDLPLADLNDHVEVPLIETHQDISNGGSMSSSTSSSASSRRWSQAWPKAGATQSALAAQKKCKCMHGSRSIVSHINLCWLLIH